MDKDIQEMFKKKNREILIHNLEMDIDRNFGILMDSLTNMFCLQFETAIKNIYSIYDEKVSYKDVSKILTGLQKRSFDLLCKKLEEKKSLLLQSLEKLEFEEEQMDVYYKTVFDTSQEILQFFELDDLEKLKKSTIEKFYTYANTFFESGELDIVSYRTRDYVMERLFGKLKDKVQEELFIRDKNLSNKGKESYEKFQELENKTTNI